MSFVYAAGILFLASTSLFGWGALVRRLARMPALAWPLTIALGLGAVVAMGGVMNLARLGFAVTLWLVAAAGLLLWIAALWKAGTPSTRLREAIWTKRTPSERFEAYSSASFILVVVAFAVLTQLPPDAFNFHDDFQKYFAHPVRQLASGTLLGSPLSALGSETLGGMAFLHSFVLSVAPLPYINGVDAVFGLGLALSLGAVAGWRRMAPLPGALLAPLLMAAIEPQYVNVSALYLGSALMAACVMLSLGSQDQAIKPSPLALGLLYAGLVALKPVYGIFPALHLPLAAIAFAVAGGSMRDSMSWLLRVLLWSTVFIAPWIALHVPNYAGVSHIATAAIPQGPAEIVDLFSTDPLFYGASMATYTGLTGLAFLAAAAGVIRFRQQTLPEDRARCANLVASALTVILIYLILVLALSPILAGAHTNLRYSIPFLVGIVPIVVVHSVRKASPWPVYASAVAPALFALVAIAAFVPSLIERYHQAVEYRTVLAFSGSARNPAYRQYNQMSLSPERAAFIRKLQSHVPENEALVAWINQPFALDYRRNTILDVEPAGLASAWATMPPSVRYVIWEYRGFGVRQPRDYANWAANPGWHERLIAIRSDEFAQSLDRKVRSSKTLYADSNFIVMQLAPP